jgi:hypothetical protein
MLIRRSTSRRDFLGALGLTAAMGPFIPFLNRRAEAQGTFPIRTLLVFTGCGSVPSEFWPMGGETDFTFKPGSITESLQPFRNKLIFPKSMKRPRSGPGGHESAMVVLWTCSTRNPGSPFGGYSKGPSIDQMIAGAIPQSTAFKSLEFGVQHDGPGANPRLLTVMCYAGSDMPIQPESSPYRMFDRLMLGSAQAPTGIQPADLERVRARRKSVIDLVRDQLRTLNTKIDRDDRIKVEQHVEGLSAIEKRLIAPTDPGPMGPGMPGAPRTCGAPGMKMGIDLKANASFPELLAIQNSLAVAALACNRTRVASLQWSRAFSQVAHNWVGVNTQHHTLSHNTGADAQRQKHAIERWYFQRMAELLQQLDSVPEGNGTMLDNTMLIYANELAEGAPHSVAPAITMVAGKAGGKLKTGRFLDLPNYDFSQLLVTAAHVMGATSINKVGDLGKEGDIPTLLA